MLRIVLICSVLFSTIWANDFDKYLKSETRAQIKIQKLVDDEGDYKKALKFGQLALDKYKENLFVMSYHAKAMYLTGDLENSKIVFMKVLSLDPTNDIAAEFIQKIEEQEAAQTNKDLEDTLGYLSDKGLDFLMIFLGFLGAEVLAKRYTRCENNNSKKIIEGFIIVHKNGKNKQMFIIQNYFLEVLKNPICFILQFIIIVTIAAAITIVFNWIELMGYFSFTLTDEKLKIINSHELWIHFVWSLSIIVFLMILFTVIKTLLEENVSQLDVANELQTLALDNDFELLKESIDSLVVNDIDINEILKYCINEEAKSMIEALTLICKDQTCSV